MGLMSCLRGLFRRRDTPLVSLVMLLDEAPDLTGPEIVDAVRRALPLSAPELIEMPPMPQPGWAADDPPARAYAVRASGSAYYVIVSPSTYVADPVGTADRIAREDFAAPYRSHVAWISVDFGGGDTADPFDAIGRIAAELMPDSCVLLYRTHDSTGALPTRVLREAMRSGTWLDQFETTGRTVTVARGADDADLAEAAAVARRRLPEFIEAFGAGDGRDFAVKVPFRDGDEVEHMWVIVSAIEDDAVVGELNNNPQQVTTVRCGDRVRVPMDEVEDWMIAGDGETIGGFSVNVLSRDA